MTKQDEPLVGQASPLLRIGVCTTSSGLCSRNGCEFTRSQEEDKVPERKGTTLITGASSGIGYELTELFARDGHDLVLVARSRERLEELARKLKKEHDISAWAVKMDLSVIGSSEQLFRELEAEGIVIDILVNNAGFGAYGPFEAIGTQVQLEMIRLNIEALTHLTKLFLPAMLRNEQGWILNVASMAGFLPGPYMAVYYATKAYVLSLSEALASELEGTGITVTALCPGTTRTGFFERAQAGNSRLARKMMDAGTVAQAGYAGLMRGQTIVIPGFRNRIMMQLLRFFPRKTVRNFVKKMQKV